MRSSLPARIGTWVVALLVGAVYGLAGTIAHSYELGWFPLGLVLALIGCAALLVAVRLLTADRWAALATWVMGVILAFSRGYLLEAATLGLAGGYTPGVDMGFTFIGTGMWLATVMFFNVWVFIWPNQKIALGLVEADADAKAKAAKTAMLFSRTNTLLSIPMLATMAMNQTLFG